MIATTSAWALRHVQPALADLNLHGLTVVGRGLGLSSAEECALKIREVAGIRARRTRHRIFCMDQLAPTVPDPRCG